jgi:phage terminase large subunit-like protein
MGRSAANSRGRVKTKADHVVRFINLLTHTKGQHARQPFNLRAWQEKIVRELFKTGADGLRQYRTCLMMLPRKNGKSEICAALALYGLLGDGEQGAEVYIAAADRDQASLVFNVAAQMVRNEPELYRICEIVDSQKRIVHRGSQSVLRAISADAQTKHGFNASMVIYDELHAAPNRELWDVLRTSQGARRQPLLIAISTAGYDRHSILYQIYDYACKVRDGIVEDDSFLPVIYEAHKDADWKSEVVWHVVNPALGDFRDLGEMRRAAREAAEIPGSENAFRRLYCNQWTEQSARWLDMHAWDDCARGEWKQLREAMRGKPCFGGLDLSTRDDMTALVLLFDDPASTDGVIVVPFYWVPEDNIRKRSNRDRVPYDQWAKDGLLTATPGNAVDQVVIRKDINRIAREYLLKELGFDPWNASKLAQELDEDGVRIVPMRAGFKDQSEATQDLGALVTGRKLTHGGHPILRWNSSNMVVRQNGDGNLAPDKSKITERIDGISALIDAIAVRNRHKTSEPSYTMVVLGRR